MYFKKFRFSKPGIVISILSLALIVMGILYLNASGKLKELNSFVEEKENSIHTLRVENEDLKTTVLKLTTQPQKSISKVKPVKQVVKKKKPVTKKVKNKKTKKNGNYQTVVLNSNNPVVKLVVYDSNGKKKTYTMNCCKESKNKKSGYKYYKTKKKKTNSKKNIAGR